MGRRIPAADLGLAALVLALELGVLAAGGLGARAADSAALDGVGVALAVASAGPLAVRRAAPLAVYLVTAVATVVIVALHYPLDFPFGLVVALYTLAVARGGDPRRWSRVTAALAAAALLPAAALVFVAGGSWAGGMAPGAAFWALTLGATWFAGANARLRRERITVLEERARLAEYEAERDRQLIVAQERLRIARELHDSAGHAINVILVQAGAARLLHGRDPAGSRRAITTIEEIARGTIGEIDGLVRALREDGPTPADPAALDELVDRYRASGLEIVTEVRGERAGLPRSVSWAAYRILQEALTNAARHGRGRADVAVWFGPDAVEISVSNPTAAGGAAPGGGHGIVGMRERASLLGGVLEARVVDGVFRLRARLPYAAAAP